LLLYQNGSRKNIGGLKLCETGRKNGKAYWIRLCRDLNIWQVGFGGMKSEFISRSGRFNYTKTPLYCSHPEWTSKRSSEGIEGSHSNF